MSKATPYFRTGFWGAESIVPKTIVKSISVKFGSQEVFIPLSAYCDLSNSRNYSLQVDENLYYLIIHGGEASTSYTAEIKFKKNYIIKRKVYHREFPEIAWEKTIYSFNKFDE